MSSAATNAIRIPVVVEIDQATGALKTVRKVAETETRAAAAAISGNLTEAERSASRATRETGAHVERLGSSFHGLGPSIHAATSSLALLGVEGNHALGGLAIALSHLAAGVSLPVIGIGLLVSGIGALVSHAAEADEGLKKVTDTTLRMSEAVQHARAAFAGLSDVRLEPFFRGMSPEDRRIAELEIDVSAQQRKAERLVAGREEDRIAELAQLDFLKEKLRLLKLYREEAESARGVNEAVERAISPNTDTLDAALAPLIARGLQADFSKRNSGGGAPPASMRPFLDANAEAERQMLDMEPAGLRIAPARELSKEEADAYKAREAAGTRLLELTRQRAAIETGTEEDVLALVDEIATRQSELDRVSGFASKEEIGARMKELDLLKQQLDVTKGIHEAEAKKKTDEDAKKAAEQAKEASVQSARAIGVGVASQIQSALSQALQGKTDWKGLLRGLFDAVQGGIADALAAGIIEGIGVKSAAASATQAIVGAFTTAAVQAAAAGNTVNEGREPIVVVNSFSESDADAFAAKMTSRGARVVVAKHAGQGIAVGTIPSRGRRR